MRDYSYENDKTVMPVNAGEIWDDHEGRQWLITHIDAEGMYPIHGTRRGPGKTRECRWMRNGGGFLGFSRLKSVAKVSDAPEMEELEYGDFAIDKCQNEWLVIGDGHPITKYPIAAMRVREPRIQGFFTKQGVGLDIDIVLTKKKEGSEQGKAFEEILEREADVFVGQSPARRRNGTFSDEFISYLNSRMAKIMDSNPKLTAEEIKRGILSKSMSRDQRAQFEAACKEREERQKARRKAGRRIIQVGSHQDTMWALCKDGTLWLWGRDHWRQACPIPLACNEQEEPEPEPKAPERRVLIVTHKNNDERARLPGDKVTLVKPEHLDRLRGCEFDHLIFDEGIRFGDVEEHIGTLLWRLRNGTLESQPDFFLNSGFLSFTDIIKGRVKS